MNKDDLNILLIDIIRPISKIEVDLKMPTNTLQKAIKGERNLPKKWSLKLKNYVDAKQYLTEKVVVRNLNKQSTGTTKDHTKKTVNNESINTMPKREDFENSLDFGFAKAEWKKQVIEQDKQ